MGVMTGGGRWLVAAGVALVGLVVGTALLAVLTPSAPGRERPIRLSQDAVQSDGRADRDDDGRDDDGRDDDGRVRDDGGRERDGRDDDTAERNDDDGGDDQGEDGGDAEDDNEGRDD